VAIAMKKDASLSPCRKYRYTLWRRWGAESEGYAMFIGLNPSTADEVEDDPTIRRCIGYARDWGYGAMCMANLFAFRATKPQVMKSSEEPIGPTNDKTLKALAKDAGVVVASWGVNGAFLGRDKQVISLVPNLTCLRKTKGGFPAHPLYLKKSLRPTPF
jgi:hypothetical protein